MKRRRDPWVALARAEKAGRGIRLTAHEVHLLINADDALVSAAETCSTECVCDIMRFSAQCAYCEFEEEEEEE